MYFNYLVRGYGRRIRCWCVVIWFIFKISNLNLINPNRYSSYKENKDQHKIDDNFIYRINIDSIIYLNMDIADQ